MAFITLSVTNFSSSRTEVGVFYPFIVLTFCLFRRVMFVRRAFNIAMFKTKLLLFIAFNRLSVFVLCQK